jgi:hypothetical protein
MTRLKFHRLALPVILSGFMLGQAYGTVITQWDFNSVVAAPDNSPAPTTGSGAAVSLGMTNGYTYTSGSKTGTGSVTSDDILSSPGVANPSFVEDTWRIRGASGAGSTGTASVINGWNTAAPEYTQGAEFDVSTVGYQDITVGFDWYCTTQGVRDLQEQYNLNISNPSGWTNINSPQVAVANDFDATSSPTNTIDLSAISGASNDANFGIRLVSAFDPTYTGAGSPTYTAASSTGGASSNDTVYNNNSGNWRFGDITFSGTPVSVPEPSSIALLFMGAAGLITCIRRKR